MLTDEQFTHVRPFMTCCVSNKVIRLIALIFLTTCGLVSASLADTIKLKDGSVIKGKIVSFENGRFTVVVGEGERRRELTFEVTEVESILFDQPGAQTSPTEKTQGNATPAPVRVIVSDTLPKISDSPSNSTAKLPDRPKAAKNENISATKPPAPVKTDDKLPPGAIEPITVKVNVLADNTFNGWTNSGWVVRKGQKIRITGSGEIDLGGGKKCPPGGISNLEDPEKLLKAVPTGALIAVIGDDNNEFIYIGDEREFVAARDGALFLGVNEGNIADNSGSFQAVIQIWPN
jgi:hypothetical protein